MILTLSDLIRRSSNQSPLKPSASPQKHQLNNRINLVIQQCRLGLDNRAMIESDPDLHRLIDQLQTLAPSLFTSTGQLDVQIELTAPLPPDSTPTPVSIQVLVNVGIKNKTPKLFDWSIRRPTLSWHDRIACWVTTEYYKPTGIVPGQLTLIVIALSLSQPPTPIVFHWNRRLHKQTEAWLVRRVRGEAEPTELHQPKPRTLDLARELDFASIKEIPM